MPRSSTRLADLRCCLSPALFRALGDPTRLSILLALAARPEERSVSELGLCCPVDLSVVSRHLRTLREAGIVEARRDGKEVRYRPRYGALAAELRGFADALEACCPPEQKRAATSAGTPTGRKVRT